MKAYIDDVKTALDLVGNTFTITELIDIIKPSTNEKMQVRWASQNYLTRSKEFTRKEKRGTEVVWGKITTIPEKPKDNPFKISALEVGEGVITLIEKLKAENKDLCAEVKQLVNEKTELEKMIRCLQERKTGKSLNVSDLGL